MSAEKENKCRRVSGSQLEILWEFLNTNRDIAAAFNRSLAAKAFAESKWRELADLLNAQGHGAYKDWKGWSKYWVDLKAKIKKRAAFIVSNNNKTGGGPPMQPLTMIESKFLKILGQDFGQGLPGVRVDPFPQQSINSSVEGRSSPISVSEVILCPIVQSQSITPGHPTHITSPTTTPAQEHATATPVRSPRRRRRRREPPMSQEAARRALVQSSQIRAEATNNSSQALEGIAQSLNQMTRSIENIEHVLQRVAKDLRRK